MTRSTLRDTVRLGYAIGTGGDVNIPVRHMVVTGITQEAGKTTTLEALITRSGRRGLVFTTKRGEGAFATATRVAPYFREQTDWRFVTAILEASLSEKLKFERSWIMRASKGAKTLADVQTNVRAALADPKTRGMSADIYYQLDQYLEEIVPQIARIPFAKRVALAPGLNVMDLTGLTEPMQHLVIRSSMLWVLEQEEQTIVVVPEAWKFAPEQRGGPVKLVAEAFVRQGAGLGNYLWLDSQDIAGVDKKLLKQCAVWILGVQREANEIKRTLDNIPAGIKKPRPADVATLELGQFYACYGTHTIKTYVQPAWMNDAQAKQVATGQLATDTASRLSPRPEPIAPSAPIEEPTVKESEARALRAENDELRREMADLRARWDAERQARSEPTNKAAAVERHSAPEAAPAASDEDALYRRIVERLKNDAPKLIRVLAERPAIEVAYTPAKIEVDGTTPKGRICRLLAEGWFDDGSTQSATRTELKRTGADTNAGSISKIFDSLHRDGFLTLNGNTYTAVPGMKVNIVDR